MKRSEINNAIKENEAFFASLGFALPPFAFWTPADWEEKGSDCDEIRDNMLGWDVTDFGSGCFEKIGLFLFTIRNGNKNIPKYTKPYAEKIMVIKEEQKCPLHFHWYKQEDIINRGGGVLCMQLYNSKEDESLDTVSDVEITVDGVRKCFPAGSIIELGKGESCTLTQRIYHSFWAKDGTGKCMVGEVSQCNDDNADNRFWDSPGRFPGIEEDEAPYRLLCNEYPQSCE